MALSFCEFLRGEGGELFGLQVCVFCDFERLFGVRLRFPAPFGGLPGRGLDGPLELGFAVGQYGGENPVDTRGGVVNDGLQFRVVLHGRRVDHRSQGITDVVVDLGGDLHAAKKIGMAAGLVDHQGIGEGKRDGDGVKVGRIEAMRIMNQEINKKSTSSNQQGREC